MARIFYLLLVWLFAITTEGSSEIILKNWIQHSSTFFPSEGSNQSYFVGYVKPNGPVGESQAHFQPFSITAFNNPNIDKMTLNYKLWLHHGSEVVDSTYQSIVTEKNKLTQKVMTGKAKDFKEYIFRSLLEFSYAFQDIKAKYSENRELTKELPENLVVLKKFPLNSRNVDGRALNMRCFKLVPVSISTPEQEKAFKETELELYLSLGDDGSDGRIYLRSWRIAESLVVCPYDYLLLNVERSQLLIAGSKDKIDELRSLKIQDISFNENSLPALPKLEYPLGQIQSRKWYYSNSKLSTLYQTEQNVGEPEVTICDIANNCYPYSRPENGKFILDDITKEVLGNTPFVRYNFDENKVKLEHISEKKLFDELKEQFAGSVREAGSFRKNVPKNITIPVEGLDVRFMRATYSLTCSKKVKIMKAYMYNNYYDNDYNILDFSFLSATTEPSFTTSDYFFADKTNVRNHKDVILTLMTSEDEANCEVNKKLDNEKFTELKIMETNFVQAFDGQRNIEFEEGGNIVRIRTNWIRIPDDINFRDNTIQAEFTFHSKFPMTETMREKVEVKRIIFGNNYYDISNKDNGLIIDFDDKDEKLIRIQEDLQSLPQIPIGSAARIEYFIELPEYIPDPEVDEKKPEERKNEYHGSAKLKMKGYKVDDKYMKACLDNSFLYQDCDYETSKCLSNFKQIDATCKMEKQHILHVEECEPKSCSNFLTGPVHKAKVYSNPSEESIQRFYPISSLIQNNETYLRVPSTHRENKDNCITFRYFAGRNRLLVEFDGTDGQLTMNDGAEMSSEAEAEVCASKHTSHSERVDGFTFRFTGSEQQFENIGDHYVEIIKVDSNKLLPGNNKFV